MPRVSVPAEVISDGTVGFTNLRGVHKTNLVRSLNLIIDPDGSHYVLKIQTNDTSLAKELGKDAEQELPLTKAKLWGYVHQCRAAWRTHVVDYQNGLFQAQWDLRGQPEVQQAVLPKVAEAGHKLFLQIFNPGPAGLRKVAGILRRELQKPTWIRVSSDDFFAPWSLIYSAPFDPEKPDVQAEGFWGYQHLIEHSTLQGFASELNVSRPLKMGLQLDQRIDQELQVRCNAAVLELLDGYSEQALTRESRDTKQALIKALHDGPRDEHVLYFCCHARQEGNTADFRLEESYLVLTDRPTNSKSSRISTSDITAAIDLGEFAKHPIVFLNACEIGQLNSIFYEGFVHNFMSPGASAVVGPQTEIPAVFAGEFARRFFERFFHGNRVKIGQILHDLRREFLDKHNNPLGMIYSLYRGADLFLQEPLQKKKSRDPAQNGTVK